MSQAVVIARIEHHAGHLEWVLGLCRLLEIKPQNIYLQIDSRRVFKSIRRNLELMKLLSESSCTIIGRCGYLVAGFFIDGLGIGSLRRAAPRGPVSSVARAMLGVIAIMMARRIKISTSRGKILLINNPQMRESILRNWKIARFSTPIGPNLALPDTLGTLKVRFTTNDAAIRRYFFSPTLSPIWTATLLGANAVGKHRAAPPRTKDVVVFLALREPDSDNLSLFETQEVLTQLIEVTREFPSIEFRYRPHPRQSKASQRILRKLPTEFFVSDFSHPRVISHHSQLTVSLGGSAAIESLIVGTPVVEVTTLQEPLPEGWHAQTWSHYGLVRGVHPSELGRIVYEVLSNPAENAASRDLADFAPACQDDKTRLEIIRKELEELST